MLSSRARTLVDLAAITRLRGSGLHEPRPFRPGRRGLSRLSPSRWRYVAAAPDDGGSPAGIRAPCRRTPTPTATSSAAGSLARWISPAASLPRRPYSPQASRADFNENSRRSLGATVSHRPPGEGNGRDLHLRRDRRLGGPETGSASGHHGIILKIARRLDITVTSYTVRSGWRSLSCIGALAPPCDFSLESAKIRATFDK